MAGYLMSLESVPRTRGDGPRQGKAEDHGYQ